MRSSWQESTRHPWHAEVVFPTWIQAFVACVSFFVYEALVASWPTRNLCCACLHWGILTPPFCVQALHVPICACGRAWVKPSRCAKTESK